MNLFFCTTASKRLALVAFIIMSSTLAGLAHAGNGDVFLTRYINGLNAAMPPSGNPGQAADLFTTDADQINMLAPPSAKPQRNREAIRQFFAGFDGFFSDWTHVEKSRMTHGNSAVWEGVAQGHHRESGKPLRLPIVFFLEFDNDGAVRELRVYVDERSIGDQLQ